MKCPVCCGLSKQGGWCADCWFVYCPKFGSSSVNIIGWLGSYDGPALTEELVTEAVEECRRIVTNSEWGRWSELIKYSPDGYLSPDRRWMFSLFADWLADNNCPLQEAAVRQLLEK